MVQPGDNTRLAVALMRLILGGFLLTAGCVTAQNRTISEVDAAAPTADFEPVLGDGMGEWEEQLPDERLPTYDALDDTSSYDSAATTWSYTPTRETEPDPEWRDKAQARIDAHRKADLTVLVYDERGNPVTDADVSLRMTRHEFGFGSAVAAKFISGDDPNTATYRGMIRRLFNVVTIESDLKWPHWEDLANRKLALAALRWLRENDFPVRGHNLLWGGHSWLPPDVPGLTSNPAALEQRVTGHLVDEVSLLEGELFEWDVVNEPDYYDVLTRALGEEKLIEWYQLVHRLDPQARLFINEYGIITGSDYKQQNYEDTIRSLVDGGAPLHGIGLQGHFSWTLTAPSNVLKTLDRFAAFGLPLEITELDVDLSDETLQADFMRDFMTVVFSHPAVTNIVMWGFWEGRHWRPNAALYRLDWSIKPIGKVWNELVFGEWWTRVQGRTDAAGRFMTRGFRGAYQVTVQNGNAVLQRDVTLGRDGRVVAIRFGELETPGIPGRPADAVATPLPPEADPSAFHFNAAPVYPNHMDDESNTYDAQSHDDWDDTHEFDAGRDDWDADGVRE
jgi:GH35 family endo-1,4-beta-xylanase